MADLVNLSAQYEQEADSMTSSDMIQLLNVKAEDAGAGKYFVIETERWAFNDIDELIETLESFKKMLGADFDK